MYRNHLNNDTLEIIYYFYGLQYALYYFLLQPSFHKEGNGQRLLMLTITRIL